MKTYFPIFFGLTLLLVTGCTTTPLSYKSAFIGVETRKLAPVFEGSAAVLMASKDEQIVISQKPSTYTGSFGTIQIPLNAYVKDVFTATFDRLCHDGATSGGSQPSAKTNQLIIRPVVEAFDYKMKMPFTLNVENALLIYVKLRLHLVVERGDGTKLVDKSIGGAEYTEYGGSQLKGEPDMVNKAITLEVLNCAVAASREIKEALGR